MPSYTQANRPIEVITPLGKDVLLITGFHGEEGLSRLFHFQIDMVSDVKKDIAFEKLLGQKIAVRLNMTTGKSRYFSGICSRFSQGESDNDFTSYHMEIVPQFWLLTKQAQTRIFQQMSVPDILKEVLTGLDVTYQIQGTFEKRNYCVQYRETDFNFASRLMEDEGIYYYFTHTADGHKMLLANTPASHLDMPLGSKLTFEKVLSSHIPEDRVLTWQKEQELVAGQHTLWDHSFEFPGKNLEAKMTVQETVAAGTVTHKINAGNAAKREIYDYPGEYAVRFDGVDAGGGDQPADAQKIFTDNKRTIGIRAQQEAAQSVSIHGTSNCRNLVSGHKLTLDRHPKGNGDYVLTALHHQTGAQMDYRSGAEMGFHYVNSFTAIPFALPFRPQRITPKPFVQGTQTATVVGPPGEEIFTDKYGRVKVQFNWDRQGKKNAASSCWVRVAQSWAGKRWGASFWPRVGQEVVVAFLEGDPDWPIIVGSVYNAEQMPPYLGAGLDSKHPKDNKVTGIKSNSTPGGKGFNEWRFDDTKGKEQIFLNAQNNMDIRVGGNEMTSVAGSYHLTVGGKDKDGNKSGDIKEQVFQDRHIDIKRNHIEQVEGNMQLTVGLGEASAGGNLDIVVENIKKELIEGADHLHVKAGQLIQVDGGQDITIKDHKTETIDAASNLHVTSNRSEKIDGNQSLTVGANQQEKVAQNHALEAQQIYFKGDQAVVIEAGTQLTIKVGGNFVNISASGVSIVGTLVNINSGGAAGSGSPPSPTSPTDANPPTDAEVAKPSAPTAADSSASGQKSAPG